jgi:two-component system phosphate regulon sensor histidine kinase PhoR
MSASDPSHRSTAGVRRLALAALAAVAMLGPLLLAGLGLAAPAPATALAALGAVAALSLMIYAPPRLEAATPSPPTRDRLGVDLEVVEMLSDPVLIVEGGARDEQTSRRILLANAAAREALRMSRPDGLLSTVIRAPDVLDAVDEALYARTPQEAIWELRGPPERLWRARATPLARDGGETGLRLAMLWLRDETEIRRVERTRADFLANASHELRTPLASLTGFIETLRGHARDDVEARDRFLAIMHGQADRMRRLIDDLMSLSRIELGEHIPPSGEADLAVLTADVLDGLGPLAREKAVRFEFVAPPPGAAVAVADRDQVLQVIQNLAENAVKFAPEGGLVTLEVRAGLGLTEASTPAAGLENAFSLVLPEATPGRTYASVAVRDHGPGLARSHLPRLTERFYRVEGQKTAKPGTGLGLAIVKHIVNRHRGGLRVESTVGDGAQFTAYFPMVEPPLATSAVLGGEAGAVEANAQA